MANGINMKSYDTTIILLVKDLVRSGDFYRNCLGCQVENEEPGLFVQLSLGNRSLRLIREGKLDKMYTEVPELHIPIRDVDIMSKALSLRGIPFRRQKRRSGAECLEIRDPDGHKIVLTENPGLWAQNSRFAG